MSEDQDKAASGENEKPLAKVEDTPQPEQAEAADSGGDRSESVASASEEATKPEAISDTLTGASAAQPSRSLLWPAALVALVLVLIAGLSWAAYRGLGTITAQQTKLNTLQERLDTQSAAMRDEDIRLQNLHEERGRQIQALQQTLNQVQTKAGDLEQRLAAQGRRIIAMSDVSRDDWLLAEAEYLLKLANQRVRIERSADGAEALLEEADAILRDLADPELYPLRRAVAQDLAALRLMKKIDVEGIYLALVALAEQVESLPVKPSRVVETEQAGLTQLDLDEVQDLNFWQRVGRSWQGFVAGLGSFFRVIPRDEAPETLLLPAESLYLQHNLRLMIERAQLALLREQQDIYRQSLAQAGAWLERYYPKTDTNTAYMRELETLEGKPVVQAMPDISNSLVLLNEYIDNLYKLKGRRSDERQPIPETGAQDS